MRSLLDTNLKEAIRSQEKQRLATLRLINAAIKDRDIAVRSEENTEGVSDREIILILSNMVKQRKQSIVQYEEGGRIELAERERQEIKIIEEFLPNQLTEQEIREEVSKIIESKDLVSIKDMGKIMGELKTRFSGRMDFGKASEIVKASLK
ncbi:GatB/YqeY domain-containing protein [Paracoccaceae bacterium]|nr:GatB/YqeY domain-containing protein [Paracoccaceae bacterium]